jgi:hypothetical protein
MYVVVSIRFFLDYPKSQAKLSLADARRNFLGLWLGNIFFQFPISISIRHVLRETKKLTLPS